MKTYIRFFNLVINILVIGLFTACSSPIKVTPDLAIPPVKAAADISGPPGKLVRNIPEDSADRLHYVRAARFAADRLARDIPEQYLESAPIIVATLVDVNTMSSKPQFGRVLSEQIASRLVQRGLYVIEVKLKDALSIKQGVGEIFLSREIKEISEQHRTALVILGTYAESVNLTVVNLRAVRTVDGVSLASSDFSVQNDVEVRNLLSTTTGVSREVVEAFRPVRARQFKVEP